MSHNNNNNQYFSQSSFGSQQYRPDHYPQNTGYGSQYDPSPRQQPGYQNPTHSSQFQPNHNKPRPPTFQAPIQNQSSSTYLKNQYDANIVNHSGSSQQSFGQPSFLQPQQLGQPNGTSAQGSFAHNGNLGNIMNDISGSAVGQIGLQLGTQAFAQVQQNMNQNIHRYVNVSEMRYYFNVSHSYVLNKLSLLLFPFRQTTWSRIAQSDPSGKMNFFAPPREDLNAPDLYIPVMAFITYILLVGLSTGLAAGNKSFTPDVLGRTASSAFFLVLFELLFIKFGFYILNVSSESRFFDLVAYCGYKFVAINTCLLLKFMGNSWLVFAIFSYLMFSFGFFLLRSLRYIVIPDASNDDVGSRPNRKRRILFLFSICLVQVLSSWLLL